MSELPKNKSVLERKIESLGYKEEWHRIYKKDFKEFPSIKQVIKLDLFEDKLDDCYVEANIKIHNKELKNIIIANNRVKDDYDFLKGLRNERSII